ncbi:carcinoembryonic antigen-related cell adhesion molecule 7-like [Hyperolius riggenbachi]|uniref:carcinoembryonic antigen-related cell adhesion molecule 7-like n=1 Tax=Hyperolius riggenbachi TaxID=752182 RepID=UPI0035A34AAC
MIAREQLVYTAVIVSALLSVGMCTPRMVMINIQLIPQQPVMGGSVTLRVTGIEESNIKFTWYKGEDKDASQIKILEYLPIVSVFPNSKPMGKGKMTAFPNASLLISNLDKTDDGYYTVAVATHISQQASVLLTVSDLFDNRRPSTVVTMTKKPEEVILQPTSQEPREVPISIGHNNSVIEAIAGSKVVLTLTLRKRLPCEFYWFRLTPNRSPTPIQSATRRYIINSNNFSFSLHIPDATVDDSGEYGCTATNTIGGQSFLFTVNVTAKESLLKGNISVNTGGKITANAGKIKLGKIIGIVLGVVLPLALVVFIYLLFLHRQKKKSTSDQNSTVNVQKSNESDKSPIYENDLTLQMSSEDKVRSEESEYQELTYTCKDVYNVL